MSNDHIDRLINSLTADLAPVRRLAPPQLRALGWLAAVVALAAGLALTSNLEKAASHVAAAPEGWIAIASSTLTAALAAFAAFQLSLPDRARAWALLPLPAAAVWLLASGLGCLRAWLAPAPSDAVFAPPSECLTFIVGLSVPLAGLLFVMLRRGHSLQPRLTAAVGGLACAAAAATLLNLIHPYDAAVTDLAFHGLAVTIVVSFASVLGNRALA